MLVELDFEDPVAWSSMNSRLKFWDVFLDIFYDYPLAGVGGLMENIIKYSYGFPYTVFVDPHNELIFILSGFGLLGFFFISISILLSMSFRRRQLRGALPYKFLREDGAAGVIIFYILLCSLTNANSAKQNIEMIICLTLMLSFAALVNFKEPKS